MPRIARPTSPAHWRIESIAVRARDGPERLRAVYQLLLRPYRSAPVPAAEGECEEATDASRHLRPRVD